MRIRTRTYLLIIAAIAVLVGGGTYALISNADAAEDSVSGEYHQTKGPKDMTFTAVVADNSIQIDLKIEGGEGDSDVHGTYWVGSFNANGSSAIISKADKGKLNASLLGSQDDTKAFELKGNKLRFEFAMDIAGLKTTVVLTK